jgi:hypothetical protein
MVVMYLCFLFWSSVTNFIYSKYNKMSCFVSIEFITEELFTRNTNIKTKLNWKLFTKSNESQAKKLGFA